MWFYHYNFSINTECHCGYFQIWTCFWFYWGWFFRAYSHFRMPFMLLLQWCIYQIVFNLILTLYLFFLSVQGCYGRFLDLFCFLVSLWTWSIPTQLLSPYCFPSHRNTWRINYIQIMLLLILHSDLPADACFNLPWKVSLSWICFVTCKTPRRPALTCLSQTSATDAHNTLSCICATHQLTAARVWWRRLTIEKICKRCVFFNFKIKCNSLGELFAYKCPHNCRWLKHKRLTWVCHDILEMDFLNVFYVLMLLNCVLQRCLTLQA